ncbi:MAG: hypothetical protein HZA12_06365 [Nitrospirae bacterium]|nr:hypothetical protein [Nitrospirota bacterium]
MKDRSVVRTESRVAVMSIFLGMLLVTGCALKGEEELLVIVSPGSAVITLGDTKQFSVDPAGTTVTWSVDGILGGNEGTVGTIDANGKYIAPSDATAAPEKVRIRASDSSGSFGDAIAFLTTFKTNKMITDEGIAMANTYSAGQKSITVNGNTIYVVWADNSIGGYYQIFFTKSSDGGNSFCDSQIRVAAFNSANQFSPSIAEDNSSGNVYVVWEDYRDGDGDIYISRFDGTDCPWTTSPFASPVKVNQGRDFGLSKESSPAIAIDPDGIIYVVWEDRLDGSENYPDIYFAISSNQGQTFPTNTFIGNAGRRPSIATDSSDAAYVVWEDLTGFPILSPTHIKIRKIEGGTSGDEADLPIASGYNARYPSITVGPDGKVYAVWQKAEISDSKFENEIIQAYDFDLIKLDGATLDEITTNPSFPDNPNAGFFGGPAYPAIASDSTYIYVAWDDQRNGSKDIYFAKSSDGASFTTNRIVNDDAGDESTEVTWHEKPAIAVSDGKAYVIWTDYRNTQISTTAAPNDVFFAVEDTPSP